MALSLNARWARVLAVSLALNVALVTALGTVVVRDFAFERHSPRSPFTIPGPRELRQALPDGDQSLLDTVLDAHRPVIRARIEATQDARVEAARVLRQSTLSVEDLDALLDTLRFRENAIAEAIYDMARDLFAGLDVEGRRALANLVEGPPPSE